MRKTILLILVVLVLAKTKTVHHSHLQTNSKVSSQAETQEDCCNEVDRPRDNACIGMVGYANECHNEASDFVEGFEDSVLDSPSACQVHVYTKGRTCAEYCKSQNRVCVGGQDNTGDTCNLDANHDRQSTANNGCDQQWNNQVCICDYIEPCDEYDEYVSKCYNNPSKWSDKLDSRFVTSVTACQVQVLTDGGTCHDYCEGQGKVCVLGQDNFNETCALDGGSVDPEDNGCNQEWNNQVCVCDEEVDRCEGMEGYEKTCFNGFEDFHYSVDTSVLNSRTACQAIVSTGGSTCADYCHGQGRVCVAAQDNTGSSCNLDQNHDRKSMENNGCDQGWGNQVCVCDYAQPECDTQPIQVWRPSNGVFYTKGPGIEHWGVTEGNTEVQTGVSGDVPFRGDFLGNGEQNLVVWRPSEGNWYINGCAEESWENCDKQTVIQCGIEGDIPVPYDYFGDGLRLAVFRPSNGVWYIKGEGTDDWADSEGNVEIQCGINGDIPVPYDYFAEGQARIAVFRPSEGNWYIKGAGTENWGESSGNETIQCGRQGDVPVPFDYFNEGQPRLAVWRPENGNWYIKGEGLADWTQTSNNEVVQCGTSGDVPLPGFYKCDDMNPRLTVWRPSNGNWYIKGVGFNDWEATKGNVAIQCGTAGDVPIRETYAPI